MKLIPPIQIADAQFVSSTVVEADYAEWSAGTAYTAGDRVIVAAAHRCYEALAATTGDAPVSSPTKWLDIGATNRWRMFDDRVGTQTQDTASIVVEIEPGIVNALVLLNVSAAEVRVTMTDATDGVVFDRTYGLYDATGINDWYPYFFDDIRRKTSLVVTGMPAYRGATIRVELTDGPATTVSVGALIVGKQQVFAEAVRTGASVGIQDYSRKEADDFGNYYVVERAYAKRARWSFVLANTEIDRLQQALAAVRATPAVFIGAEKYDATLLYGFYRDFDIVISYPTLSECSIEIEGLI